MILRSKPKILNRKGQYGEELGRVVEQRYLDLGPATEGHAGLVGVIKLIEFRFALAIAIAVIAIVFIFVFVFLVFAFLLFAHLFGVKDWFARFLFL